MEYQHELILPNKDLPFKMFIFEGAGGNYIREKHWHRSVEIFALFEGSLEFFLQDRKYSLTAGEFMLVNSNELHSIRAPYPNLTLVLQIPLEVFRNYYSEEQFILFSHDVHTKDDEVMHLLDSIYRTYEGKKYASELKVISQFYMLLYLLISRYRTEDISPDMIQASRKLDRLSRITSYIKENYAEELSLESVSRIFSYSPTYVSHMFRKYAQTTFKNYLQDIRLHYAFRMLSETDLSLTKIALSCGFASSKAFSRLFLRKYHLLPSDYRRNRLILSGDSVQNDKI